MSAANHHHAHARDRALNRALPLSLRRIAQDHRSYARSHNFVARQKDISPGDKAVHRALGIFHREAGEIFATESKRLKGTK